MNVISLTDTLILTPLFLYLVIFLHVFILTMEGLCSSREGMNRNSLRDYMSLWRSFSFGTETHFYVLHHNHLKSVMVCEAQSAEGLSLQLSWHWDSSTPPSGSPPQGKPHHYLYFVPHNFCATNKPLSRYCLPGTPWGLQYLFPSQDGVGVWILHHLPQNDNLVIPVTLRCGVLVLFSF
jgi:hypothetical protein